MHDLWKDEYLNHFYDQLDKSFLKYGNQKQL